MSGLFETSDSQLLAYLRTEGVQAAFDSMDGARSRDRPETGPGLYTSQELREHMNIITDHLACDTYGGVEAIKWARNSYNDRIGTDTNLMIKNGIGAVWPAAKSVQPDDTAAIRVLRYTDRTGFVHGNPDLPSVLASVDNVISLLQRGVSVLICCVNGAHRSATLTSMTLMRLLGWSAREVGNLGVACRSSFAVSTARTAVLRLPQ
eukprot:s2889_g16.t1